MTLIYLIIGIILLFGIFIFALKIKIILLEKNIIKLFFIRNNLIPSIYEITKNYFIKHNEVFSEILKLRKIDFLENKIGVDISKIINTQKLIHNELEFIFQITNKHIKLNKDHKYLYIKDILIEKSEEIGKNLELYKIMSKKINNLIFLKNITIIGLLIPIKKIEYI